MRSGQYWARRPWASPAKPPVAKITGPLATFFSFSQKNLTLWTSIEVWRTLVTTQFVSSVSSELVVSDEGAL